MTSSKISDPQTYIDDSENSIIKLKLKKPKSWNWELSTSKSSPNINFPKILLYDHKNNLLAETDESNCIVNDKSDSKLTNGKVTGKNKILSSSSTVSSKKNETKRSPKTNIDSNCIYNNIDPNQSHPPQQIRTESLSHPNKIDANFIGTPIEPLQYLDCRKRSRSVSFNEMKHFLNNLKHQLNGSGIDCKITNHNSERKHPNRIGSSNEYKHLNGNFNGNQLRRIKSISDINQAKKGSKQNLPEPVTPSMYNGKLGEKGALRKSFKGKEYAGMSPSSCRTIYNVENVDEHERTAIEAVNGTDIFKNDVHLSGNQTTTSNRNNFLLTKSKSSMEVVSSGGDGQRNEKKKYRRAHSTNSLRFSTSILERISEFKRRSSSTDSEGIGNKSAEPTKPRYFLRTSQAGTLLICNESFKNKKIRRRRRSSSKRNENDECSAGSRSVNGVIELKERSDGVEHRDDDTPFHTNETKKPLPEELNDNFDKCSKRYETAIANIDDLIAKVVSTKRTEPMNGMNANSKEHISINKKSCNDEIPIIDEHRIENELHKNESAESLIKNRDNQLDKCINIADSVGISEVVREKRKKRAKSLGKSGFSTNISKNDSCGKVQKKFAGKFQCRSASVGSQCHSSSSSEDDINTKCAPRGRSRVKRRRRQQNQQQGEFFFVFFFWNNSFNDAPRCR